MAMEQTLCIIKPDAVSRNYIGRINTRIEERGMRIIALKMLWLSKSRAEEFYAVHRGRSFYEPLVSFMSSGPVVVQVLSGEDAINDYRKLIGKTNPLKAAPGTLRADFSGARHSGALYENALHGSDQLETARAEIPFFFKQHELHPR